MQSIFNQNITFWAPKRPISASARSTFRSVGVLWPPLTLQKVVVKPMKNQHVRFSAPSSPLIYPSHLPSKVFRLHFSLSGNFFSWIFWNYAPHPRREHNSKYRHKASLIQNLFFSTSKTPKSSPCWWWFSALSLCCSLLSPLILFMPPQLDLKKRRKYVYYYYRRPPWATLNMYPT